MEIRFKRWDQGREFQLEAVVANRGKDERNIKVAKMSNK